MMEIVAGVVTVKYNEQGRVTYAEFEPEKQVYLDLELVDSFSDIPASYDSEVIKANAQKVLAKYFAKVNEIDMADHFENGWVGETLQCDKYDDGRVKLCKIRFTFKNLVQ